MAEATGSFVICNRLGLHARAATALVRLAERFDARVEVYKDGQGARATSVIELLLLCATAGSTLEVSANGKQAGEAVQAIGELIAARFGEAQ